MVNFNDLLNAVSGDEFEERPVDVRTFVNDPRYLNLPITLSEHQYELISVSTQIYKLDTLVNLYGLDEGMKRYSHTCNEVIFQLGKGSGKDFTSTIACAYIVYLLLCLKDPANYYGKTPGDTIDILNVAINATQASNVFFKGFVNRIKRSPWFMGKYDAKPGGDPQKQNEVNFQKNITVYSGHSEREAWEGYNLIYVVLDEISGFALESTSGNEQSKTAQAVYDMYRASVTSRFPEFGKLVLLSFPRFKNDFIQQRYNAVIAEKVTLVREHTFKISPGMPDGTEGNEFRIEWEEDHITRYNTPKVYALKRPTWEVNPTVKIGDLMRDFLDNPVDALSRFACMPPDAIDAFFKSREKIETAFSASNGVDESGVFMEAFKPDPDKRYFIHVDLARKHDHCAVAMSHVDGWETRNIGGNMTEPAPRIKVDAVRWWTPTKDKNVDFTEVREYIVSLQRRGFNIKLVTFDRWESYDISKELREYGLRVENLSVAKKHYTDMAMVVHEERLAGPQIQLLIDELLALRIMPNDKVDHPRKGSKDLADATCGSIFNAIAHTPRTDDVIEVKTITELRKEVNTKPTNIQKPDGVIRAPKRMPDSLSEFMEGMRLIGVDND
jgi:phage terminase large subunit-like protein